MVESEHPVAYGINAPLFFFTLRGRPPAPGYGHLALQASGKAAVDAAHAAGLANGGADDGAPGPRPQYGPRYYAGYLLDPDRLRVEVGPGARWSRQPRIRVAGPGAAGERGPV